MGIGFIFRYLRPGMDDYQGLARSFRSCAQTFRFNNVVMT